MVLTGASTAAGTKIVIGSSGAVTQGTKFVKNKLRQIYFEDADSASLSDAYTAYVAKFGTPVAGQNVFLSVKYVASNGQSTPAQTIKATVAA